MDRSTGNMCRKFGEVWTCGFWDLLADRQMFHRNADHNTPLPHWSRVITIQYNSQSKASEVLRFPLLLSILSPHCRILQIHTCISSLPQPKSFQYKLQRHVFIPQTGIRSLGTLCWSSPATWTAYTAASLPPTATNHVTMMTYWKCSTSTSTFTITQHCSTGKLNSVATKEMYSGIKTGN